MTDLIQTSEADHVLKVVINRPDKKNALTHEMYEALVAAFERLDAEDDLRVLYITGTEDCFTAGNDMGDFLQNPPKDSNSPVSQFLGHLLNARKPIVVAANGAAVGVGTTMLLHCDLVYLGESAKLQMPFVSLGLCPEAGSSFLLPEVIGHQRASQLLMLSDTFGAEQAMQWGLANQVFADSDYQAKAYEKACQLAAQPPESVRLTKAFLKQPKRDMVARAMGEEGSTFIQRLGSDEAREAMTAFVEKRQPDFSKFS